MTPTLRESMEVVADPENLDDSVSEVFQTMLGMECRCESSIPNPLNVHAEKSITAVVGFGGMLSGACVFRCDAPTACRIATCLAGLDFNVVDDTVKDAMGEICNMLAGTWKSKVPDLAANCGLSVPAVITGSDYELHVQAPEFKVSRMYSFENIRFEMTIVCDGLQ